MRFEHTNRKGFWLGFADFFTAGLFFVVYMSRGGLQAELDEVLGRRTQRYWVAYLLGVPDFFLHARLDGADRRGPQGAGDRAWR